MADMVPSAAEAAPSPAALALCLACLLATAGCAMAVQLSARMWWADLATFFVPYLAVVVALSTCAALWVLRAEGGKPVVLDLAVLTVIAAFFFAAISAAQSRAAAGNGGPDFTVMTYNVQGFNGKRGPVIAAIRKASPDVVVLQECERAWNEDIASLGYSGRALVGGDGQLVEVLTRFPVASVEKVSPEPVGGLRQSDGYRVTLEIPDGAGRRVPLVLYAIHPSTPRTYAGWKARNAYLEKVSAMVAAEGEGTRVVVAGDWNVSSWSGTFRNFLSEAGLEENGGWSGPGASRVFWRKWGFVFGSPVDHIAVGPGIEVASYGALRPADNTSDHDPVMMTARIRSLD